MKDACVFVMKLIGNKTIGTEITKILQQKAKIFPMASCTNRIYIKCKCVAVPPALALNEDIAR